MTDYARFALRLAALLPLAALLLGVNASVDPAHLFDRGATAGAVADALMAGRRVTGVPNIDERALQRALAARATRPPDVLVLGSSRVMTIGAAELGRAGVRNGGVSGAGLLDVAGVYELYRQRALVPTQVLLGVDPWMFNAQSGETRWVTLAPEARAILGRLGLPRPPARTILRARASRLATLVSLDYFQSSVHALAAGWGGRAFTVTTADSNPGLTRRPDGSIVYGSAERHASPADVARSAQAYAETSPIYQLGGFTRVDPADSTLFVRLLGAIRRDGPPVTLFLAPYHPIVYRALADDGRYAEVPRVEAMVRRLAADAGVRVCGAYDPAALALGEDDFYDGMHPRPAALTRALSACASP